MPSQPPANADRIASMNPRNLRAWPAFVFMIAAAMGTNGLAQLPFGRPAPPTVNSALMATAAIPEPIYWKQHLFLIPYQWSSAADPSSAQAVWLIVSKDRGASWHKISEARPQVKAFNYHAEGDGEYWFAIRTIDRTGQAWPPGPYQPELRVIVDTTMPRIDALAGQVRPDGAVQMQWRGSDTNLDPASWKIEVQINGSDTWFPVPPTSLSITQPTSPAGQSASGITDGQAVWQPPAGSQPRALRATVYDRAGNSAAYGAAITALPSNGNWINPAPAIPDSGPQAPAGSGVANPPGDNNVSGWVSASDAASGTLPANVTPPLAENQPWPVGAIAQSPFRLAGDPGAASGDTITTYGNPVGVGAPYVTDNPYLGNAAGTAARSADSQFANREQVAEHPPQASSSPSFAPLEPFRESSEPFRRASLSRLPAVSDTPAPSSASELPGSTVLPPVPTNAVPAVEATPQTRSFASLPAGVEPKRVGSRTFSLEYELEDIGRWGVSTVELWGTRDGGQTWRSYATDRDARSPLIVTVDDEGLYGFRIVVESASGVAAIPPAPGDAPELWVAVDLRQPVAELTSIEPGDGNLSNHLILRWRANDDNFDERPIALFYSSRPAGPWSAIATNLSNTGEFAWQVQRHVPERFYLRLEARDMAGNLAAFQTREPVTLAASQPNGRLRAVEPVGPTATSPSVDYR